LGALAGLTAGAGWKIPFGGLDAALDYAFVPYGVLGATHRITLGLESGSLPLAPEAMLEAPPSFDPAMGPLAGSLLAKIPEGSRSWKVSIRNGLGKEVRRFEGRGAPPPGFSWDGKDAAGQNAPEGSYQLDLELQDQEDQRAKSPVKQVQLLVPTPEPTPIPTAVPTPKPSKVRYEYSFALSGDILFDLGKADLRPQAAEILGQAVSILLEKYPESTVLVAGHTDNVALRADSPFRNNEAISLARAQSVKNHLVAAGLDASRVAVIGYGSRAPVSSNDTEAGRSANRRVDLLIYGEKQAGVLDLLSEAKDYMKQKQWLFALKSLLRAAELDKENAMVYRLAGTCYFNLGQKELGVKSLRRSLELNPDDAQLKAWLDKIGAEK